MLHAQTRCKSMHVRGFIAGQKNCRKSGLGRGLLGRSAATGRRPWAAGALLAKPL